MTKARLCDKYEANWFDKNHLGFVNLFAYALLPHTRTEYEELALAKPKEISNGLWPRPWLYLRTTILFAIAFVSLYVCWRLEGRADASTLLPGMVIMGSLAMPITLLVFFWEINKWRTLPLLDVLRYFLVGSCAAIVITFGLQYAFDYCPDYRVIWDACGNYFTPRLLLNIGVVPMVLNTLTEEFAKTLIIFIFLMRYRRRCHILQGILIGATVGAGFAVFESAGYAVADISHLFENILIRSLMAPACHVAWGALIGGGTMMMTKATLRYSKLFNPKFILLFIFVCLLHFAWNFMLNYSMTVNGNVQLSILTWFLLTLMIWRGVKETRPLTSSSV